MKGRRRHGPRRRYLLAETPRARTWVLITSPSSDITQLSSASLSMSPPNPSSLPSAATSTGKPKDSLGSPVGSPVMAPGAIVAVSIVGIALLTLVFGAAWWWRRRTHVAKRSEVLPVAFQPSTGPASSCRSLLGKTDRYGAAGHRNHSSPTSTDPDPAHSTTDVPMHALHDMTDATLTSSETHSLPEERAPSPPLTTIDARISLAPRLLAPELETRRLPRLMISDHPPDPDGLTPLSPRPRRHPGDGSGRVTRKLQEQLNISADDPRRVSAS
ncbi:hypothetical protein OH76DRAFT_1096358 [Lentinus brumalis]|uniref:Uncharacterized protein n=1 Tax=Lentinus brumalis TaxID=2498619 RepID=A0A371CVR4_9APHY|nr:hypothetical protein OH76DRAFT_1096358 [Polyporus brumalis]